MSMFKCVACCIAMSLYISWHKVLQDIILLSMHETRQRQIRKPSATTILHLLQNWKVTLYVGSIGERCSQPTAKLPQCLEPPLQAIPGVIWSVTARIARANWLTMWSLMPRSFGFRSCLWWRSITFAAWQNEHQAAMLQIASSKGSKFLMAASSS